jgi:hypothetical protein
MLYYLMLSVPNGYKSLLWFHDATLDQLLKTVALQSHSNTNSEKQSPTVSVYPLRYAIWAVGRLLKIWNFRFRHVYCGHCAILSTLYNGYSATRNNAHNKWILRNTANKQMALSITIHRIFDGYCSVLSTEYTMDIAQYCPRNIQYFWDCTIKSRGILLTQYIAQTFNF